jgi:hypothetical protein
MNNTDSPRDPVNKLAPKEPGAPPADDHDRSGPPAPEVIARGYEADGYDTKSVLSVPLLVVLFFVLAFSTVTVIFYFIAPTKADPRAHPGAVQRNKPPLNERLGRYGRGKEVDQPQLEPAKLRAGDPRAITQPEVPGVNSPVVYAEDLRPTPERFPTLYGGEGGKLGLDKTLGMNADALKGLFPVQESGAKPIDSQHVPTGANAGRGFGPSEVRIPQLQQSPRPPAPAPPPKKKEDKK